MDIYIVQFGDTIEAIAEKYGVSPQKLIQDNDLVKPDMLVPGEALIITYPTKTYIVQEGDTLQDIADKNGISIIQLLRNNPFLSDREYIYPGEALVISYDQTKGKVSTGGFAYPFINNKVLLKTLPFLTYLSIFNYTVTEKGELVTYYDDTELIQTAKNYGVAPLMLITTLSVTGKPNIEAAYDILINEALQDQYIELIINLIKTKGYYGVNLSFQYLNISNQKLYTEMFRKISVKADREGIPLFITINPNKTFVGNELEYEKVDYSGMNQGMNSISFLTFSWGMLFGPPAPVTSISDIKLLIDYVLEFIAPERVIIGIPVLGYDWELPYVTGLSGARAITLDSIMDLAREVGAVIQFDELSQTPYILYQNENTGTQHIIWFIDARSINSLLNLVSEYGLQGTGIWNIMVYYPQLWLVINSQCEIENLKL